MPKTSCVRSSLTITDPLRKEEEKVLSLGRANGKIVPHNTYRVQRTIRAGTVKRRRLLAELFDR